ncbi:M14 family metallopeptidase [Arenibacter sp. GZD96]|uniref:M14 family metallopeptidase n=1 Tax=Aurantibrevibacter litoralis TaxID=3106030 RepID=UPI002AFE8F92|nr:M14 family metallopeptidase [Arenibacter sp. GZD-96]MEA1787058.1 M14 family metallopeptidase [Arenibacter sp. GZD-96]
MNKWLFFLFFIAALTLKAQERIDLNYYLPQDITYDGSIPKPMDVIGHEVGEWHVTHDKLIQYMQKLAEVSPRFSLENRGATFEGRPLLLLTVTSPKNHGNLAQLQKEHVQLSETDGSTLNVENMPVVVYQGFSIHGNEPSGSNAALAYAYYLAAAQGPEIEALLDQLIILLDPSFNPDGLQRFAYWANTNKSAILNPDKNEREYHEVWPGGRTNHYWFDMNRDWLPVQLPESKARIKSYHQWLPNILTDHHEMGTNSTFFFQPGEPSRVHPLTPKINQDLTMEIGTYHAKALDGIGSLYYTQENYDDYYYGKGSTFPDINGAIGILFEQGSSRGHIQESENGVVTFPFTIRNQFLTALSTIEAAFAMRTKLLTYQRNFYNDVRAESTKSKTKAIVFGDAKDRAKTHHLAEILERHNIRLHALSNDVTLNGKSFTKEASYVVPLQQKNAKIIQAMFEKRTTFTDSLFYDISGWTFPMAFNVDYAELPNIGLAGSEIPELQPLSGSVSAISTYAYLFEWNEYYTPKALHQILQKGLRAKVAKSPFSLEGNRYDYGTIMIPVQNQILDPEALFSFLNQVAKESFLQIQAVSTGLTQGIDLGSNEFDPLEKQKVALVVGRNFTYTDAGEIWHLFDQRYDMQLTKIDIDYFNSVDLNGYTAIIIPNSRGTTLDKRMADKLKDWVKNGGTLIGYRNAAQWLSRNEFISLDFKKDTLVAKNIAFDQKRNFEGAQNMDGAIFKATLDRSHPITYGFKNEELSVFRNTNIYITADKNSYNNPIKYTNNPLQSGYISKENLALLKNTVPFKVQRVGQGRVIVFTDNTNFRAFWYGTNKLLMNAIFFSKIM